MSLKIAEGMIYMWGLFAGDILAALIFLYVPGIIAVGSLAIPKCAKAAIAPLLSSLLYFLFAFIFGSIGIQCSWGLLFGAALVLSALFFVGERAAGLNAKGCFGQCFSSYSISWKTVLLYLFVAFAISGFYFVGTLDGPGSIYQENDNIFHLSLIRDFLDSGNYSTGSILSYPALWHVLASMVANFGGANVAVAVNAVNFSLIAVVFSVSIAIFLSVIFRESKAIVAFGSICVLGMAAFPWGFLLFGPLYPNLMGYALLPGAMTLFILMVESDSKKARVACGLLFFAACLSLLFAHPNAIFVGIVFMAPFCVSKLLSPDWQLGARRGRAFRIGIAFAFAFFVIIAWSVLYLSPMFAGVVSFEWPSYLSVRQALVNLLALSYSKASVPQLLMAVFVALGAVYLFLKKQNRWLIAVYGIFALMYVVGVATEGFAKHYLTGFWYTDGFRISAAMGIAAVPLAAAGIYSVYKVLLGLTENAWGISVDSIASRMKVAGLVLASAALAIFVPSYSLQGNGYVTTGFGQVESILERGNALNPDRAAYDSGEISFVEKAKEIVGDEMVINLPYDGSAYSYALDDLNVEFRNWYGYETEERDSDSAVMRESLNEVSSNEHVVDSLKANNVHYLILLDYGREDGGLYSDPYVESEWEGITSVTDETPGFKVLLSEDDMRLYEICY